MPQTSQQKDSLVSLKRTIANTKKKLLTAYTSAIIDCEKKVLALSRQQYLLKEKIDTLKEQQQILQKDNSSKLTKIKQQISKKNLGLKQLKQKSISAKIALKSANNAYKKISILQAIESDTIDSLNKPKKHKKKIIKKKVAKKILKKKNSTNRLTPSLYAAIMPSTRSHNKPKSIWNPLPTKRLTKKPEESYNTTI